MNRLTLIAAVWMTLFPALGFTHEGHQPAKIDYAAAPETPFGRAADPGSAQRTVRIELSDRMRFFPDELIVKQGEIVRIVPVNTGAVMHEIVIGTSEELRIHAEHMKRMPDMQHDAPYMAHVAPGASGEIGWQFTREGEFLFACLLPGHFEAGMIGTVRVLP